MKLARREKYFVILAAGIAAIILFMELLINPFFENRARLKKGIYDTKNQIERLEILSKSGLNSGGASGDIIDKVIRERESGFSLYSFADKAARDLKITDKIKNMNPSYSKGPEGYREETVEIKFEAITLDQLTDYLYLIEDPNNLIVVKRIRIDDNKIDGYIDSTITVFTYVPG